MSAVNKKEPTGLNLEEFDWEGIIFDASVEKIQEDGHVVTDEEKEQLREMIKEQWTK